ARSVRRRSMCMCLWLRRFPEITAVLTAAALLSSCIPVGPDFLHPAAPDVDRYTPEKLAPRTSSTDAPTGQAQRFVQGRDIPQEWWRLFRSRALNALIERSQEQSHPAVDDVRSARREGSRLRPTRQVSPAGSEQLHLDAPANRRGLGAYAQCAHPEP